MSLEIELLKFYKRCFRYAINHGSRIEEAEDFASDSVIRKMLGRKAERYQLYADHFRNLYGKKKSKLSSKPRPEDKLSFDKMMEDYKLNPQVFDFQYRRDLEDLRNHLNRNSNSGIEYRIEPYLKYLDYDERQILFEYAVMGYSLLEIGKRRKVSECRICQRMDTIKKKILKSESRRSIGI